MSPDIFGGIESLALALAFLVVAAGEEGNATCE